MGGDCGESLFGEAVTDPWCWLLFLGKWANGMPENIKHLVAEQPAKLGCTTPSRVHRVAGQTSRTPYGMPRMMPTGWGRQE